MESREVNINDFLDKVKPVESTINLILLKDFKNFNQIQKGLHIKAPKMDLMLNPQGYQNFLNEVEKVANKDGITLTYTDDGDSFTVIFK